MGSLWDMREECAELKTYRTGNFRKKLKCATVFLPERKEVAKRDA